MKQHLGIFVCSACFQYILEIFLLKARRARGPKETMSQAYFMSAPLSSLERKIQPVSVVYRQCHVQMSIGYRYLDALCDASITEN
jgi:hypothetical protein